SIRWRLPPRTAWTSRPSRRAPTHSPARSDAGMERSGEFRADVAAPAPRRAAAVVVVAPPASVASRRRADERRAARDRTGRATLDRPAAALAALALSGRLDHRGCGAAPRIGARRAAQ